MNDLISIIVPVYNSGQYLYDCIQSILQQSYSCFELILIDDGSTDDSKKICFGLCKTDKRIIYLSQDHKGVSAARNIGIQNAKGKYLFFMDSDDVIHFKLLEILYDLMEKNHSQVSGCRYYLKSGFDQQLNVTVDNDDSELFTYCDNSKASDYFIHWIIKELSALGGKMILRDIVQNIQFDESLRNGEDTKFIYQLLQNGADVVILNRYWYYYRNHEGSLSKVYSKEAWKSMYACERYICDQEKEAGRIQNAIVRENYIIECISEWYTKSKLIHNQTLLNFASQLANHEKRRDIYSQCDLMKRIRLFFILHCYPLYWWIYRFLCIIFPEYIR